MQDKEIYKAVLGMIDLTTLNSTDTYTKVAALTEKVNRFHASFPDYPLPASICVYPNFAATVAGARKEPGVDVTVVGGCFPASQSPLPVKIAECEAAVRDGADEVELTLKNLAAGTYTVSVVAENAYGKQSAPLQTTVTVTGKTGILHLFDLIGRWFADLKEFLSHLFW